MNLLKKNQKETNENAHTAWKAITSEYYEYIDESSFNEFVKGVRKDVKWDCELLEMKAAVMLAELGQDSGWDALEEIGLKGDLSKIKQKIKGRITNHDLKTTDKPKEEKPVDFYVMMAQVRKRDYKVNSDILLQEWAAILKSIKEENERKDS